MKRNIKDLSQVANMFAALGYEARLHIVLSLLKYHPEGLFVGELQKIVNMPSSTLSHHIEALKKEGFMSQSREGRYQRCRVVPENLKLVMDFLFKECCKAEPKV